MNLRAWDGIVVLAAGLVLWAWPARGMDPALEQFLYAKQQQIQGFSESLTNKVPAIVWRFYDATRHDDDWTSVSNSFHEISLASRRYAIGTNDTAITPALATRLWPPLSESYGACEQFHLWNHRWLQRFGKEVIGSIPPGSIYFGGTDPGRFIISALAESQVEGKPFFILTQNQLADGTYMDYLRVMYGRKIKIPTLDEAQKAFEDYLQDATRRQKEGKLQPGEEVHTVDGRVEVAGQVAVMNINGLIARQIFEQNLDREFYVEESFPLDWMYPYLTPHGLIFKINHKRQQEITEAQVTTDQQYWKKLTDEALGSWLNDQTPISDICDFAIKYGKVGNLTGFPGDKDFASNDEARKCCSKLRSSIAGLYAWRALQARDVGERKRMNDAADLAFRQSYALCPASPEAIYRYVNLLLSRQRVDDAILIAKSSLRVSPANEQVGQLLSQLEKYRRQASH